MTTPHPKGKILRAWIDGQGSEPDWKIRPAMVVRYDKDEDRYQVLVGTHTLRPNDPDRVPVTSGRSGPRVTGLPEKTEINCDWWAWIDREDIDAVKGHLPPSELSRVCQRAAAILEERKSGKRPAT
jgi:mRNA-degrading endonuclease toxin of MazEF toxin-antitoxin module